MPNYIAKKSVWSVVTFWSVIACVLIIPIFTLLAKILNAKKYRIEFYDDKIITYKGFINISRKQVVFAGVTGVSVEKGLKGRIFNFGNVVIDAVGKWDIDTVGIKNPEGLEDYLNTKIAKIPTQNQFVHM